MGIHKYKRICGQRRLEIKKNKGNLEMVYSEWIRINYDENSEPNKYSGYVYDAVWLYALALGR